MVVGWVGQILLGHDESGQVLGLKLLVGPRWRRDEIQPAFLMFAFICIFVWGGHICLRLQ